MTLTVTELVVVVAMTLLSHLETAASSSHHAEQEPQGPPKPPKTLMQRLSEVDYRLVVFLAVCIVLGTGLNLFLNKLADVRVESARRKREEKEKEEREKVEAAVREYMAVQRATANVGKKQDAKRKSGSQDIVVVHSEEVEE